MAAQKSRFKGGGRGGVTGMLTAFIAPSFDCLAEAMAAVEARRSATRLKGLIDPDGAKPSARSSFDSRTARDQTRQRDRQ
jgi:hypothetical protein